MNYSGENIMILTILKIILITIALIGLTVGAICSLREKEPFTFGTAFIGFWAVAGPVFASMTPIAGIKIALCLPWIVLIGASTLLVLVALVNISAEHQIEHNN